jgi:polyisoprenoid-binding protein YceI
MLSIRPATAQAVIFMAAVCAVAGPRTARTQEIVVTLDPASTTIEFTLPATLHTVHGTFKLKSGQIRADFATGKASGEVVVDATSGESGNTSRDANMHNKVLESQKFPEIIFTPQQITQQAKSSAPGIVLGQGTTQVEVSGVFRLHGQDHPMTLTISVQPGAGGTLQLATHFSVPYVQWGLKNPSTFLLHVAESVDIDIRATAAH